MDGDPVGSFDERWNGMRLLARGRNRVCVHDPASPGHCLKFERPPGERARGSVRRRFQDWRSQRDPGLGQNGADLKAMAILAATDPAGHAPFARSLGMVHTRWGPALRCECVRLPDGTPAESLHAHLHGPRRYPAPVLCDALDRFEAWLLASGLPLFALNPGNFVVVPRGDGVELVCVDAKSLARGKELLPLSRWLPALGRRKIRRRIARLKVRIAGAPAPAAALHCAPA